MEVGSQSRSEVIKLVTVKGNPFDFFLYSTFNLVYYLPYVLFYLKFIGCLSFGGNLMAIGTFKDLVCVRLDYLS